MDNKSARCTAVNPLLDISQKNIVFRVDMKHTPENIEKLKNFLDKNSQCYLLHLEDRNKDHKKVKEHIHIWIEEIFTKRKSFSDSFTKNFPELTRQGKGGYHKKSMIKYLSEDIQFYYNFKNIDHETFNKTLFIIDTDIATVTNNVTLKTQFYLKYKELLVEKKRSSKFLRYYLNHQDIKSYFMVEQKEGICTPSIFTTIYQQYCLDFDAQRPSTQDQRIKYNYVMLRVNRKTAHKQFSNNLEDSIARDERY